MLPRELRSDVLIADDELESFTFEQTLNPQCMSGAIPQLRTDPDSKGFETMRSPLIVKLCAMAMFWSLSAYAFNGTCEAQLLKGCGCKSASKDCGCCQSAGSADCGCSESASTGADCGCDSSGTSAPAGVLGGCSSCESACGGAVGGCRFCLLRKDARPRLTPGPATGMSFFSKGKACQNCSNSGGFFTRLMGGDDCCSGGCQADACCDAGGGNGCQGCGLLSRIADRRAAAACQMGNCGTCQTCVRNGVLVDMRARSNQRQACGGQECNDCSPAANTKNGLLSGLFSKRPKGDMASCGCEDTGCNSCSNASSGGLLGGFGNNRGGSCGDGNCSGCSTMGGNSGVFARFRSGNGMMGGNAAGGSCGDSGCSDCTTCQGGTGGVLGGNGGLLGGNRGMIGGNGGMMGGNGGRAGLLGGRGMASSYNACSGDDCNGCATCGRSGIFARFGNSDGCSDGSCGNGGLFGRGCGRGGCGLGGRLCDGCNRLVAGEIPHKEEPPYPGFGAQAPTYAYPYYTTRGPRDFLQDACGPPMILPYSPRTSCLPSIGY